MAGLYQPAWPGFPIHSFAPQVPMHGVGLHVTLHFGPKRVAQALCVLLRPGKASTQEQLAMAERQSIVFQAVRRQVLESPLVTQHAPGLATTYQSK